MAISWIQQINQSVEAAAAVAVAVAPPPDALFGRVRRYFEQLYKPCWGIHALDNQCYAGKGPWGHDRARLRSKKQTSGICSAAN